MHAQTQLATTDHVYTAYQRSTPKSLEQKIDDYVACCVILEIGEIAKANGKASKAIRKNLAEEEIRKPQLLAAALSHRCESADERAEMFAFFAEVVRMGENPLTCLDIMRDATEC